MKYLTTVNDETYTIEINEDGQVIVNDEVRAIDFRSSGARKLYTLLIDNQSYEALVDRRDDEYHVLMKGKLYTTQVADERAQRLAQATGGGAPLSGDLSVRAPMPGMIVTVLVEEGQTVEAGDAVVILESMKMENELKAPADGVVSGIHVQPGDSVNQKQVLVTIVAP